MTSEGSASARYWPRSTGPCSTARLFRVTSSAIPLCSKRSKPKAHSSVGRATSGDELQAEVDLFLAHLPEQFEGVEGDLIDPVDMLIMLRTFGMYDVGRTPAGEPLDVAEKLLEGERKAQAAAT